MMTSDSERPPLFDARGNRYIVVSPTFVPGLNQLADDPIQAAATYREWAAEAVNLVCRRDITDLNSEEVVSKPYWSDGLLVGPFPGDEGIGLIIVNTDETLAERSGNGLTIFAHFLRENGIVGSETPFKITIFHSKPDVIDSSAKVTKVVATCWFATLDGEAGVWVDMGAPSFGPTCIEASPTALDVATKDRDGLVAVLPLTRINPTWRSSVFVNVGNPHCVTIIDGELPSMQQLHDDLKALEEIANSALSKERPGTGELCKLGINLQWAKIVSDDEIEARVFERGEGPTLSSGSSAVAVAAACRHLGQTKASQVLVKMPGGTAPIRLDDDGKCYLFGQASRAPYNR